MGSRGPLPNPNARRGHATKVTVLPQRNGVEVPDLPDLREWTPATVQAWQTWWRSPMGAMWADADAPTVLLAAVAYDAAQAGGDPRQMAEYRQLADRLGLSPAGRARLGWKLQAPGEDRPQAANVTKLRP